MECANTDTGLGMSVIIATYRRPAALKAAVESLWQQTRPPDEVVIAAWAGDAPSLSVVEELARDAATGPASCAVTPVVTTENTLAAKENAGMQAARGDIVCFMDDDAVARPDWLRRIERHYGDPTVGAVGGRDVVWLDGQVLERQVREVGRVHLFGRLTGNHHNRAAGIRAVDFLKGCNMSFRRELLSQIDRRVIGTIPYGFEIDMGLAVRAQGHRVVYDPEALVDHYPSTDYSADGTVLSRVVNHNQTYVLLKRLPWTRKLAFLLYTFLIGDQNTIGLLRVPWLAWRQGWPSAVIRAHLAGKLAGILSYVSSLRERHDA